MTTTKRPRPVHRLTPRDVPALPIRTYPEQTVVRATGYAVRHAVHALCPKVRL